MKSEVSNKAAEVADTAKRKTSEAAHAAKRTGRQAKREAQDWSGRIESSGRHAISSAQEFVDSVRDVHGQFNSALSQQASNRPYVALGAAAGIGFVLAGGLTVRLTSKLIGVGARLALSAAVKQLVSLPEA
jgi:ElaB/YqjD/DUF883 family membrane-anchored ribosome-binding protein